VVDEYYYKINSTDLRLCKKSLILKRGIGIEPEKSMETS